MTLFTDTPFEKMMIQKPDYGKRENPRRSFLPHAARAALTRGSPLVWDTVSENWKPNDRPNDKRRSYH